MRSLLLLAAILLSACASTTSLRLRPVPDTPPDAEVTVDDHPLGSLAWVVEKGVALPDGVHRITILRTGFLPWDLELKTPAKDKIIELPVALVAQPED
jgi:hypothetical protein